MKNLNVLKKQDNIERIEIQESDEIKNKLLSKYFIYNNNKIYIRRDDLKNLLYKFDYYNEIAISPDGNCLYRSISYLLYGNEENHMLIRDSVYNFIKCNLKKFIPFCYIKNGQLYVDVEIKKQILNII